MIAECWHCGFNSLDVIKSAIARHVCHKAVWDYLYETRHYPVVWQNDLLAIQQGWP